MGKKNSSGDDDVQFLVSENKYNGEAYLKYEPWQAMSLRKRDWFLFNRF